MTRPTRPLYESAVQQPAGYDASKEGHAGLWFDKFCDQWRVSGTQWKMSNSEGGNRPKLKWINGLTQRPVGKRSLIEEYVLRQMQLAKKRGGRSAAFITESRFVTGMGRSHPVENGFAWHSALGTPFLPGSSIKGMTRAWVNMEDSASKSHCQSLLGNRENAGRVCFLDAIPLESVSLEADIMTPHYAGWSAKEPPGDWRSPTPIPFLVTSAKTPFLFSVIPCGSDVTPDDLETTWRWLIEALMWEGGGAKTAVGYGRFKQDDERTAHWVKQLSERDQQYRQEQRQKEAMESPVGRWRLELEEQSEADILEQVRIHLEKEPLSSNEQRAFAEAVVSLYPDHIESWRRGVKRESATGVGKKKLRERARLLDNVMADTVVEASGQERE